ncbi:MAG: SEC-C domain-containing protein [Magnetococcales bacterium]|nr:SEC-C domain-containing protein [Magnetococcales bacterium]
MKRCKVTVEAGNRVETRGPCPCGSGKKHKRCCLGNR